MLITNKFDTGTQPTPAKAKPAAKKKAETTHASGIGTLIFFIVIAFLLYKGWQTRDIGYLTAEHGLGYALGIIGGSMMLALLIYPLRKRIAALRVIGPIKHWFRIHMILGVLGPTLILYHCNFGLGALNSNVALLSMSIVAASGLLGRYFYSRIHHGLYGSQATVQELQQESNWVLEQLTGELRYFPELQQRLNDFEQRAIRAGRGWFSFFTLPWLGVVTEFARFKLWRQCRKAICQSVSDAHLRKAQLQKTNANLRTYFGAVRKVAEFSFYARLFSAWHVLHLPLFVMMIITGIIHVLAVHMY